MEAIDDYLEELKLNQEIDDYVKNNIYPERLRSKIVPIYKYFKSDTEIKYLRKEDCDAVIFKSTYKSCEKMTMNCIDKCRKLEEYLLQCQKEQEKIEQEAIQNSLQDASDNTCPICIETLGENDYFVPLCGHKICRKCALYNLCNNKNTGDMCSLCRTKIF